MTVNHPSADRSPISQMSFDYIRVLVRRESGIVLDDGKTYLVNSRLLPIARQEGFSTVGQFISHLQSTAYGDLHIEAIEAIATTETSFFRDLHPFTALREQIIPEIIKRRKDTSRTLSIWSAACSSGQEPHSISMILRDRFPSLSEWNLQLLASDISRRMLERAKEGVYSQLEVNRGLPAPFLVRYFTQKEDRWHIKDDIRVMFRYFQQNLTEKPASLPPIDILMLRNVLIYFDVVTRRKVLRFVRQILRPDGYLILGAAETTLNFDEMFIRKRIDRAVVYQVKKGGGE